MTTDVMTTCSFCDRQVPADNFCEQCGGPLRPLSEIPEEWGGRLEAEPTRAVPGGGEKYEYVDNDMTIDGEYTVDDYALDNEAAEAEGAEQTTLA